jgi:hypothetical protein
MYLGREIKSHYNFISQKKKNLRTLFGPLLDIPNILPMTKSSYTHMRKNRDEFILGQIHPLSTIYYVN